MYFVLILEMSCPCSALVGVLVAALVSELVRSEGDGDTDDVEEEEEYLNSSAVLVTLWDWLVALWDKLLLLTGSSVDVSQSLLIDIRLNVFFSELNHLPIGLSRPFRFEMVSIFFILFYFKF
jgi:hypothetical protein